MFMSDRAALVALVFVLYHGNTAVLQGRKAESNVPVELPELGAGGWRSTSVVGPPGYLRSWSTVGVRVETIDRSYC
jgi:hypothetical protein